MRRERTYTQQYSHIYTKRIVQLRPLVAAAARAKWADVGAMASGAGGSSSGSGLHECKKVIDLRPGSGAEWLVIGCIYKDQPLKPSILDEYSGDRALEPPVPRANYASSSDSLVCEDESGRVALTAGWWHPVLHGGYGKALPRTYRDAAGL